MATVGPRNHCLSFALSPDERYVALHRHDDPDTVLPTIWVMDQLRKGALFRFTDLGATWAELSPVWSPDSSEILFSRGDDRAMHLMRRALNGGASQCVLDTAGPKFPNDWSSDGQLIAYSSQVPDYQHMHTWIVSLSDSGEQRKPCPFLQHSCEEFSACFSPGEAGEAPRWIAYSSNETGCHEVYIRDFPAGDHKWQVSNQGGLIPHWRRDRQELFYLTPEGMLMAVMVNLGTTVEFGTPQALFTTSLRFTPGYKTWMNQYAVMHDGQRFLFNDQVPEGKPSAITAVIPW